MSLTTHAGIVDTSVLGIGGSAQQIGIGEAVAPETTTLLAAMSAQPDATRKALIDRTIKTLKESGAWALMDLFYLFAAHDEQSARLNWKSPSNFPLVAVVATAFTVDRGFKGDGATTSESTAYNPTTVPGTLFAQNSAHMGIIATDDVQSDNPCCGHPRNGLTPRSTGNIYFCNSSSTSNNTVLNPNTNAIGHYTWSRNNSATFRGFKNGIFLAEPNRTSTAPSAVTWRICGNQTVFSTTRVGCFYVGAYLTDGQIAQVHSALSTYMAGIGLTLS